MDLATAMWVPMGGRVLILAPNDDSTHAKAVERFSEKSNFRLFSSATEQRTNSNFGAFGGPMALGTWA